MSTSDPIPADTQTRSPLLQRRMPGLDALRGLAVLLVIAYHELSWMLPLPLAQGSVPARVASIANVGVQGVPLFFALSGFLITGILLDSPRRQGFWRSFYWHRAMRILPALLLTLVYVKLRLAAPWSYILASTFYLANMTALLGIANPYGILWSVAVEEQFYLVWPLVVRLCTRRFVTALALLLLVVEPVLRYLSATGVLPLGAPEGMTWLIADKLAIGAMLALFLRSRRGADPQTVRWLTGLLITMAAAIFVLGLRFHFLTRQSALGYALQPVPFQVAFAALILLALRFGASRRMLALTAPLRFLGYLSYGLYLYHVAVFYELDRLGRRAGMYGGTTLSPGLWAARFLLGFVATVTVAYLSRRYFEEFFLRRKHRFDGSGRLAGGMAPLAPQSS